MLMKGDKLHIKMNDERWAENKLAWTTPSQKQSQIFAKFSWLRLWISSNIHMNICVRSNLSMCMRCYNFLIFDFSLPGDAYKLGWTGSSLIQVMACRLIDAILYPAPVMIYNHWDHLEQTSKMMANV